MTAAVAPGEDAERRDDEQRRDDLRGRDPEERPVVHAQVLEREADDAVPHEEQEQQVARAQPAAPVVADVDQGECADHPRQRLVQEQRVEELAERRARVGAGRAGVGLDAMGAVDRDAPRQRRRRAVQLLVEEVAPARDGLHHEQAGRDDVRPTQERHALVARIQEGGHGPGRDPAVHAQPGVRRQEDLDRVVLVQRPLVDDVVQPAADQRGDGDDDHPVAEDVGILPGPSRETNHDQVGGRKPDRVADAVPVNGQRPQLDGDRVRDEIEHPRSVAARLPILAAG